MFTRLIAALAVVMGSVMPVHYLGHEMTAHGITVVGGREGIAVDRDAALAISTVLDWWATQPLDTVHIPVEALTFETFDARLVGAGARCADERVGESGTMAICKVAPYRGNVMWDKGFEVQNAHRVLFFQTVFAHEIGHWAHWALPSAAFIKRGDVFSGEQYADCASGAFIASLGISREEVADARAVIAYYGSDLGDVRAGYAVDPELTTNALRHGAAWERMSAWNVGFREGIAVCEGLTDPVRGSAER